VAESGLEALAVVSDGASAARPRWPRVVLTMSGEARASAASDETIDKQTVDRIAREIAEARQQLGVEIGVVIGGGNIWRGATGAGGGMDRAQSDHMGMLGTVINALALQDALERHGQPTRVQSAIEMAAVCEPYIRRRAIRHLEKGRVVIFAAGLGSPFFTTDTPAALRAAEIGAGAVLKGTAVDGVYTADPRRDPAAVRLLEVTFDEVLSQDLRVMDLTAFTICRENGIPILVFDVMSEGNIIRAMAGEPVGTLVTR
jgi:uridylate kinase